MSLYPQSHLYGQPYGGSYPYQYPPQFPAAPPTYYVDPNTFRRDYSMRLAELTINSRPIIQNLSLLAQDFTRFVEIVVQCIEAHIRRVPIWMKLPAFYLLDAISKNVFEPYARHFATVVIPLFLDTYEQVDQATRSKMEEMLLTWRTGAPNGKELFGVVPQVAIERGVWGGEASHTTDSSNGYYRGTGQISKSQVLSELEFTLGQKERALQSNPFDTTCQNQINVLQQLRRLVEAGVSQEELRQILDQLRAVGCSIAPPPASAPQPYLGPPPPQSSVPPAASQPHLLHPYSTFEQPKGEASGRVATPPATSVLNAHGNTAALSSLLQSLVKAGVVTAPGTTSVSSTSDTKPATSDLRRESFRAYRESILSQKIKLTSADIIKTRPPIVRFLYDQLPVQCKQCGIRFAEDVLGKKMIEDHLDMHFRQNRKANQNIGRGHSRSWFVSVDDWVHDVSISGKGEGRSTGHRPLNAKAAVAAETAKREAELRAQFVVVPPGDEAKPISCPICKETIKAEFIEDDEDWVWKNAVKKDDRIYHATCHAEAISSTSTLAARLRTELAQRSRSGTPDGRSTPPLKHAAASTLRSEIKKSLSPAPESNLTGTKRKIESDSTLSIEANGTPPSKKAALSPI